MDFIACQSYQFLQLDGHAMRGAIFENLVVSECLKHQLSNGEPPALYFWRDSSQLEVDLLIDNGQQLTPIEIKSGSTLSSDQFRALEKWLALSQIDRGYVIYGGDQPQTRGMIHAIGWRDLCGVHPFVNSPSRSTQRNASDPPER